MVLGFILFDQYVVHWEKNSAYENSKAITYSRIFEKLGQLFLVMRKCFFDDQDQLIYIVFQDFLLVCLSGYARINIVHDVSWSWVMPDNKAKCKFTCLAGTHHYYACQVLKERNKCVQRLYVQFLNQNHACLLAYNHLWIFNSCSSFTGQMVFKEFQWF